MSTLPGIDVLQRPPADAELHGLSPYDDLPVHHLPGTFAANEPEPAGWAERYYFNVLRGDGAIAAVLGAGIYPRRGVAECYFCRFEGDRQINVRACQPLPRSLSAGETAVPFALHCVTPMAHWAVRIAADAGTFAGDYGALTRPYQYTPIIVPASEPDGPWDHWEHVVAAGRWQLSAFSGNPLDDDYLCIRDRTWGMRSRRLRLHNWLVFECDGCCINVLHQERADGSVMYSEGGIAWPDGRNEHLQVAAYDFRFDPHTREARSGFFELTGAAGTLRLDYETVGRGMRLGGAGYTDSQGDADSGMQTDSYDLDDPEVANRTGRGTTDIGARARLSGLLSGTARGVVESAVARDHVRFGSAIA